MNDSKPIPETPAPGSSPEPEPSAQDSPAPAGEAGSALRSKVIEVLKTCYDPEIPVNIYELGLIYDVDVEPSSDVSVRMTLTSPMCPVAGTLPLEVESKVKSVEGVKSARVEVVWDPPWTPEKMTEAARLQLGLV